MTKTLLALAMSCILLGCQATSVGLTSPIPPTVTFAGGDGLSCETAILIKGAKEDTGVQSEYGWLAQRYPGYYVEKQSFEERDKRLYDVIEITTREGVRKKVYFDITEFYQRY